MVELESENTCFISTGWLIIYLNNQTLKKWEENDSTRTINLSEFLATKNKNKKTKNPLFHKDVDKGSTNIASN